MSVLWATRRDERANFQKQWPGGRPGRADRGGAPGLLSMWRAIMAGLTAA